jgi:hypothetical protein
MSEARDELRRTLRETAAAGRGAHPEPDELAAYHGGFLPPEAERRLRDHLVACGECAALLLDLEGLADPGFGAGRPGAAAERDAAWESFRAQIAAAAPVPPPVTAPVSEPAPAPVLRGTFRPERNPRWLYALAATLLLAVGVLSYQVVSLSHRGAELSRRIAEISRPEVNAPVVDLFPGSSRGDSPSTPPVVRQGSRFFILVPHAVPLPSYREYGMENVDAHTGRLVVAERGRPPHRDLPWSLHLSRETLGAGDYRVRLFGIDGSRKVPIEEYALRVLP